ncbi:hypothetical protein [Streptomyces resistomycificus]|uniref:Uncharacterized protein n=1 Tax=Streptomyces resistomycificus TaxID=67356 RepID=A0A0L8L578_9ACTN|nr:hypothetical protein [Streptomyces resistomycificus]KOG33307.1 hypothetical protein ADK37_23290 [Streptomyces resistomycificus]KUN99511.1 hypothetical protein AQJ84_11225 [Streptomyces resistomycificus]
MSLTLITSAPSSDAAYREGLIRRYLAARDRFAELALLAEAARYDKANPGASLTDELLGASLGDVA